MTRHLLVVVVVNLVKLGQWHKFCTCLKNGLNSIKAAVSLMILIACVQTPPHSRRTLFSNIRYTFRVNENFQQNNVTDHRSLFGMQPHRITGIFHRLFIFWFINWSRRMRVSSSPSRTVGWGFESNSKHGYLCAFILCVGSDPPSKESFRLCIGLRNWKSGHGSQGM
jgi:hypothetical protein